MTEQQLALRMMGYIKAVWRSHPNRWGLIDWAFLFILIAVIEAMNDEGIELELLPEERSSQ